MPCLRSVGAVVTSKSRVVKTCTGQISILFNSIAASSPSFLQVFVHTHTRTHTHTRVLLLMNYSFWTPSSFVASWCLTLCSVTSSKTSALLQEGLLTTQHGQSQSYGVTVLLIPALWIFHCAQPRSLCWCVAFSSELASGFCRASVVIWNIQGSNPAASLWESGSYKEPTLAGLWLEQESFTCFLTPLQIVQ